MSQAIITVSHLGKKYRLQHQAEKQRYTTLRDELAGVVKGWFRNGHAKNGHSAAAEDFWALKDVSFEIQRGEVVGIIGRNGAGKSTLLKVLSRITEPTTGRVHLRGRVASLLEVGTGFHPELTGRENIFLNGAILGMSRAEIKSKFDEIVDFAEVEKFLDTPVKRYSSGMYVRLAFAVAAHLEPEILVVDEVLAVGDASFQKKCLGKMQDVAEGGRTVLFVSHNMGVVTSLCPKAIWLDQGAVRQAGPAREIVNAYLTLTPSHSPMIDLASIVRKASPDNRLRIQALRWIDCLPVQHGQPLRARIDFLVTAPMDDVAVGIGFSSLEGVRLLTYETDYQDGFRPSLSAPGLYSVEVELDSVPLGPAIYNLDVGCRSGDNFCLDYIPAAAQIEIIPGPKTPGHIVRQDAGARLESRWSWVAAPGHQQLQAGQDRTGTPRRPDQHSIEG